MAFKIKDGANVGYTTAERDLFSAGYANNEKGTIIYNSSENSLEVWDGVKWVSRSVEPNKYRANSTTTQSMSNDVAGQLILLENELENTNFVYSNGVLLFLKSGFYSIDVQLHLDATSGQNAHFESWFEYSVDASPTVVFPDSGRFIEFRERTEGMITYSSHLNILSGTSFILKGRSKAGSVELSATALDNGTSVPSVVVSVISL